MVPFCSMYEVLIGLYSNSVAKQCCTLILYLKKNPADAVGARTFSLAEATSAG